MGVYRESLIMLGWKVSDEIKEQILQNSEGLEDYFIDPDLYSSYCDELIFGIDLQTVGEGTYEEINVYNFISKNERWISFVNEVLAASKEPTITSFIKKYNLSMPKFYLFCRIF